MTDYRHDQNYDVAKQAAKEALSEVLALLGVDTTSFESMERLS